jgi:hypothetical protein
MMVTHKGETMHATLSFAYPDDEQKLKDALAGERYRIALEKIQDLVDENAGMTYKLTAIKTMVIAALEDEL